MQDSLYSEDEFNGLFERVTFGESKLILEGVETSLDQAKGMVSRLEGVAKTYPSRFYFGNRKYISECIDCLERILVRLGVTLEQLGTSRDKLWFRVTAISCRAFA